MWAMIEKLRMRSRSMSSSPMLSAPILLKGVAFALDPIGSCSPFSTRRDAFDRTPAPSTHQQEGLSHVANIKSQKKRILTNAKAADRNKAVKSELRTRVKTAQRTVGTEDNAEAVRLRDNARDTAAPQR